MFVAMNRFQIVDGNEERFEEIWRNRETRLKEWPGFRSFHLLKGAKNPETGLTLYASHTIWESRDAFVAWTKSEHFRASHRNAGDSKGIYAGPPVFEGFEAVLEE